MPYDSTLNVDRRAKDANQHVARGMRGSAIELIIPNGGTTVNGDFEANGKLGGLLVDIPELGGALTLTVDIFPQDATNDEARIFTIAGLGDALMHFVDIRENTTGNVPKYLFGFHNMKVTSSGAITGPITITVVPVLSNV